MKPEPLKDKKGYAGGFDKLDGSIDEYITIEKLKSKIKGEFTQEEIRKGAGRFVNESLKVRKLKGEK